MHFKVSKKILSDNINIVSKAVSILSPLPVLRNIKIDAKENTLALTASDSEISIKSLIQFNEDTKLEIIEEGSILLDGKYLSDMVRKIDSDIVEIEVVDGLLTYIKGLAVNFELNGMKVDNYPLIDFSMPEEKFVIKADLLKDIISQTCFAASDKENRPVLTGLNMKCEDNQLLCVATDSYRLAKKEIILDDKHNFNIVIPAKSLNDLSKIITSDNDVTIALNDKKALFECDNILYQTRLIEGLFPETSKLIPTRFEYELLIDSRDILNAIDRASFIKNEGICIIKMEMDENEVNISSRTNEITSQEKILPISYKGDPLKISFKANYVYDAIKALNTFQVRINFGGEMKPFVLTSSGEDDDVLQLVLPIKTYN